MPRFGFKNTCTVSAVARYDARHVQQIFVFSDVSDFANIPKIVGETERILQGDGLNLLINNAGIIHRNALGEVTAEEMRESVDINCIAPTLISQVLKLDLLPSHTYM
jgi:short-subunit dehydrogenase